MGEPAETRRPQRRIDLSAEEIDLAKLGPLSSEESERLLEYLAGDEHDEAIEAWMADPVGPPPWRGSSA